MLLKKSIALLGLAALCFASCTKDVPSVQSNSYTFANALAGLTPTMQTFAVNGASGGSVVCTQGTRVIIPANAFVNALNEVQTGTVQVSVMELLTKSDMLLSSVLPISNGEPLVSGGEVFMEAKVNGTPVKLAPGKIVEFKMPQGGPADNGLIFFSGAPDQKGAINWTPGDTLQNGYVVVNGDTVSLGTDSLQWCNADRFLLNPTYVSFTVNISGVTLPNNYTDIGKFAFYDNQNTAWGMTGNITNNSFTENHVANVPVHLIVYFTKDGKFYAGMVAVTPANGGNYTVNVAEISPANFKAGLQLLP